jgi:two-component system, NarL family, response regulator NreC
MVRILLDDSQSILRAGLRTTIQNQTEFEIVGKAGNGISILSLVKRLEPDIVFFDLCVGNTDAMKLVSAISKRYDKTNMIIFSAYHYEEWVITALRYGVKGYILEKARPDEIIYGLLQVLAGHRYLSPDLSNPAYEYYGQKRAIKNKKSDELTLRELEILHLLIEGHTQVNIGRKLNLSSRTIESHRHSIMKKLALHNEWELTNYGMIRGLSPGFPIPPKSDCFKNEISSKRY